MNRWHLIDSPNSLVIGIRQCQNRQMDHSPDISMTKIDPAKNMRRFYTLSVQPNLFGGHSVMRCWGRIGTQGQLKIDMHQTEADAIDASDRLNTSKRKRGYRLSVSNSSFRDKYGFKLVG